MTPAQLQSHINGLSGVAKKVYEVVPIQEAWPARQIHATLSEITRSTMDMHVFRGCLNALKESGLIRETGQESYRKIEVKQKKEVEMQKPALKVLTVSKQIELGKETDDPISILSGLSSRLRALAEDIDSAAISIADGIAENTENLGKLKQLQSILKSLS